MYLITSPIVRNGISWPRFGKGKYTLTINLELTTTNKVFVGIGLIWWRVTPLPNFAKFPYAHGFPPTWFMKMMALFGLYYKTYVNGENNIRFIQTCSLNHAYPLNSQHVDWNVVHQLG